ncbi:MAG: hypothetical protein K2Q22_13235 [Cytophagales bacterium]|nr:hypothetical protein [Cytophagales bacterium]
MKNYKAIEFIILLLLILQIDLHAQNTKLSKLSKHLLGSSSDNYYDFDPNLKAKPDSFLIEFKSDYGLGDLDKVVKVKSEADQLGFVHSKYHHYYNGIIVEGSEYILHSKMIN